MSDNEDGTDCTGLASWQEITDLVVVEDSMLDGRVRLFLGVFEKGHSHSAPEGAGQPLYALDPQLPAPLHLCAHGTRRR